MDPRTLFIQLSALLTGQYQIAHDTTIKAVVESTADEYLRQLRAVFADRLQKLIDAYARLASATPAPKLDDALLNKLRADQAFKDQEFVAKQIVNIWYFSQFKAVDDPNAPFLDGGGFYVRGLVWPTVKAHAIGFSTQPHGYWSDRPAAS
jgi:hypothetical protein